MHHSCHTSWLCKTCNLGAGTQLQLIVWSLAGSSFHVIVLLYHCFCWLLERWEAARYVFAQQISTCDSALLGLLWSLLVILTVALWCLPFGACC